MARGSNLADVVTWADGPMCSFDLETTGVDVETARIVSAAVIRVCPGEQTMTHDWLVNPGIEIPAEASAVHGITTEQVQADGADPVESVAAISADLADAAESGMPTIVFNAPFDLTLLDRECRRHNVPTLSDRIDDDRLTLWIVDPLVLDRHLDQWRKGSRKLVDVAAHYGITLVDTDAHSSAGDALAAARVAWRIAKRYPVVGRMDSTKLMDLQSAAHGVWAANFEAYRRTQGIDESISRDWPMRLADTLALPVTVGGES